MIFKRIEKKGKRSKRMKGLKGFVLFVAIFVGLSFFSCGHVPETNTTQPEKPEIETTEAEFGSLTIKINFDGKNSRALNTGERSTLTEAQKNKLKYIYISLYGISSQKHYWENISVENPEHAFDSIIPGIYRVFASGSLQTNICFYNLFEGKKQITVNPGQNEPIAISLYLNEWQPVFLSLPEEYSGEKNEFHVEFQQRGANGIENCGASFNLNEDKTMLHGTIPLAIVGEMRIDFENQFCLIDDNVLLSSLIEDSIIPLSECRWEPTASASLEIGFSTDYVVVPTDYPTIQAAINAVEPGTTIRLNPGTYNESIVLKPEIRIEGDILNPGNVTIESDDKNTIFASVGNGDEFDAEICGVIVRNNYQGEKTLRTAAIFCELNFNLKMNHCVVESLGVADCIVGNYTEMELTNLTLIGPGENSDVRGIVFYNTSNENIIENIIFCHLQSAANDNIQNSILWQVENTAFPAASTFSIGDPQFLEGWAEYTPSSESDVIKLIMEKSGNYPGAVMPQRPADADNDDDIEDTSLTIAKSIGSKNIAIANDQFLGAFEFTCKGEAINISALPLTVITTGDPADADCDAILNVELVDPDGNVVAGPKDLSCDTSAVSLTDTFTVPVGRTVYRVQGDLQTNVSWTSGDTVCVQLTPSEIIAVDATTSNSITASPNSVVTGDIQTVKAAKLVVTRNTLPTDDEILPNQKDIVLSSWNFDATDSGEPIRVTSILWAVQGQGALNTNALTTFIDRNKNGQWDESVDEMLHPINDGVNSVPARSTFALDDPVIINKGASMHIALKGDKNNAECNDCTENWGLVESNNWSPPVVSYGVETGNAIDEEIIPDIGPTLTTIKLNESFKIKFPILFPHYQIILAGLSDYFIGISLYAKNENMDITEITFRLKDGGYGCNKEIVGDYKDVSTVYIYEEPIHIQKASFSFPSSGVYTVHFQPNDLRIPTDSYNDLTILIKADLATIDPDMNDAPGTASADLKISIEEIKAVGVISNQVATIKPSVESKTMILRKTTIEFSEPNSRGDTFGATKSLSNGNICIYGFQLTANVNGSALLYKTTFQTDVSSQNIILTNPRLEDENGNVIGRGEWEQSENSYKVAFIGFDNPDFESELPEAIELQGGENRTFRLYTTISGAVTGDLISTIILEDENCSEIETADQVEGNFIWSDNYQELSIVDAIDAKQWYNSHLVLNKVPTLNTFYRIYY